MDCGLIRMTSYYKIRHKLKKELYRKSDGTWNKSGKIYDTLGKLKAAITMQLNYGSDTVRQDLNNWEIVEYQFVVKDIKQVHEVIDPKKIWALLKK